MSTSKKSGDFRFNAQSSSDKQSSLEKNTPNNKDFKQHYLQHVSPHTQKFEKIRLEKLKSFKTRLLLSILIEAAIVYFCIYFLYTKAYNLNIKEIGWAFAASNIALYCWLSAPCRAYTHSVKETIFPHIFSFFGNDFIYSVNSPLSVSSLKASKIIPDFDSEETEDYAKGNYSGVGIELMEAKLFKINENSKKRTKQTVFRGIFIQLTMNKNFSHQTIIKTDYDKLKNWLTSKSGKLNNFKNVQLKDPMFENPFEVISENQVEADYLLTESFIERLLQLTELLRADDIECSFYDNHILLMINTLFNGFQTKSIFRPVSFEEDMQSIISEMNLIFNIIEILKLNQKIEL